MQGDISELFQKIKNLEVISNDKYEKKLAFLGKTLNDENVLLIFTKESFSFASQDFLTNLKQKSQLSQYFKNDIFSAFKIEIKWPDLNSMDLQIIYPAPEKLIRKYSQETTLLFKETYQTYQTVTRPFILKETSSSANLQWIYNILEKKAEVEKILYEDEDPDNGFIVLPDSNFDLKNVEDLQIIALSRKKGVFCIRELNKNHLELLKNIESRGIEVISQRFGVKSSELRIFIHYQPTYYHFHVHFTHIGLNKWSFQCERAHNLAEVIQNIQLKEDYYQVVELQYPVALNSGLYESLKEHNLL